MSLAKLRKHFNDPLFVRTSAGMEPTPHAIVLINMLEKARATAKCRSALDHQIVFDPKISDRMFRLHSTDIAQVTLLPKLMKRMRALAPSVCIKLDRICSDTPKMLESGELDLAVGFILPWAPGSASRGCLKKSSCARFARIIPGSTTRSP